MSRKKLLVVDDEPENRTALEDIFRDEYQVITAKDGLEALERIQETIPDLVLLDILMPRLDGLQTCHRMRQKEEMRGVPIVFLTSKNEPQTEVFGLDLGADDFIAKPFNKDVLKARVKKRLNGVPGAIVDQVTALGEFNVHWSRQEARNGDAVVPLTTKELGMLRLFVENKGRVLSRDVILEKVWAETYITDRTIDSHVKELRKKIPPLGKLLKTIYGSGYRLDI
jgi:two-component system alkaline phosphatase synthesis response regulator PhoP